MKLTPQSQVRPDFALALQAMSPLDRARIVERFAARIAPGAALREAGALDLGRLPSANVPHPWLRQALLSDPATSAVLSCTTASLGLGTAAEVPFRITRSHVVMLPTALIAATRCLAAAARWGLELVHLLRAAGDDEKHRLVALSAGFHHGAMLLQSLNEAERRFIADRMPGFVERALLGPEVSVGPAEIAWLAGLVEGLHVVVPPDRADVEDETLRNAIEERLCAPVEQGLVAGGDSRLSIHAETGLNRYGTTPRPRPEAIHFSSSTASSITDYGFAICEWIRQKLLQRVLFSGAQPRSLRRAYRDNIESEILTLLNVDADRADLVVAPSGTDTELLAVLLALAAEERPLTNILVAPEETGRGVVFAGAGQFFDEVSATGAPVGKGQAAWPEREIATCSIPVREGSGEVRGADQIRGEIEAKVDGALALGHRVLLHVLIGSKTGISAPDLPFVEALVARNRDRIDVVVDACQLRTTWEMLGDLLQKGWMLQISGSKFLTGPPFSGALVVPHAYRSRRDGAVRLLGSAPGVGSLEDWSARWWSQAPQSGDRPGSFGPLLRWTAALAEAHLLQAAPATLCRYAFERFREALERRLRQSEYLETVDAPEGPDVGSTDALPGLGVRSIVCFAVSRLDGDGLRRRLGMPECQRVFELLNLNLSERLPDLDPYDRVLASQPAHIGQPVELQPGASGGTAVLRLVIGARFFTAIAFAGRGATEAALESEIADAIRALDKLEMIVRNLDRV